MIKGFARKDTWQASGRICDSKVWGCLSNLRYLPLCCCVRRITALLTHCQLLLCSSLHAVSSCTEQWLLLSDGLTCLPCQGWRRLSFYILAFYKTLFWWAGFPQRSCQLPSPVMFSSCWWTGQSSQKKHGAILQDTFQWPSLRCFLVNQRFSPLGLTKSQRQAEWGGGATDKGLCQSLSK